MNVPLIEGTIVIFVLVVFESSYSSKGEGALSETYLPEGYDLLERIKRSNSDQAEFQYLPPWYMTELPIGNIGHWFPIGITTQKPMVTVPAVTVPVTLPPTESPTPRQPVPGIPPECDIDVRVAAEGPCQIDPIPAPENVIVMNELLDVIINETVRQMSSSVDLEDVDEEFSWKILGTVRIKGLFTAYNGSVWDIKTLKRTGPVTFVSHEGILTLSASLGLGLLEVIYGSTKFQLGSSTVLKGRLVASCFNNSVSMSVSLVHFTDDTYKLRMNNFLIDVFENVKVKLIEEDGKENSTSKLLLWVITHFKTLIKHAVNMKLGQNINRKLSELDITKDIADVISEMTQQR